MTPLQLLRETQFIERNLGRTAKSVGGEYHDRLIDIDILLYDRLVMHDDALVIPHPLMTDRLFVMEPLCEIAPDYIHPLLQRSIKELLIALRQ
jgi:2-amino-4-hydroxy-6-hydroxymethyldihydropteridine diphosphokinase